MLPLRIRRHLFTRSGEVAVRVKKDGYIVPLSTVNHDKVVEVVGTFEFGPWGSKQLGKIKPIEE